MNNPIITKLIIKMGLLYKKERKKGKLQTHRLDDKIEISLIFPVHNNRSIDRIGYNLV